MIIVDTALKQREDVGRPIQVGIIGAGYMGRGMALQIEKSIPGMRVAAIYNRTPDTARFALEQCGIEDAILATGAGEIESAIERGKYAYCDDAMELCRAGNIDAIVEATGEVEFGAQVTMAAIENGKHVILMNAEVDAVIGPILKRYADSAGVVITNTDGDQPGVIMNLFRWVETIGYHPVLAGLRPFVARGGLWTIPEPAAGATRLLAGRQGDRTLPVAWTRMHHGHRVFYTTLGHPHDFHQGDFLRLLAGAAVWTSRRT